MTATFEVWVTIDTFMPLALLIRLPEGFYKLIPNKVKINNSNPRTVLCVTLFITGYSTKRRLFVVID